MRIAVITRDKPGHLHLRVETRDAHLAYIKETGIVEMAGPFLDDTEQMCGSLIVLEVENMAAAQVWPRMTPIIRPDCSKA